MLKINQYTILHLSNDMIEPYELRSDQKRFISQHSVLLYDIFFQISQFIVSFQTNN